MYGYEVKWGDKEVVGSYVTSLINGRLDDLVDFFRESYVNILWSLLGRQDVYYDRYSRSIIDEKPPEWKIRIITNLLFPQVRATIAKHAKQPIWDVLPATTEQEDINIANLSKNILTHYWFYLGMPEKFIDFLTWLACTGNGILKVGWDAKAGQTLELNPEERAILAATSGKNPPKTIKLGDPFIGVCSPFSVIWEKGVKLKDSPWVAEITFRSPEWIKERYKLNALPQPSDRMNYDLRLFNIHKKNDSSDMTEGKVVHINFMTRDRVAVLINGKCELVDKNPYGEINYIHVREVPLPGNEYGTCAIGQNRSSQAQYNGIRSKILQHASLMGNPKWMVARGARVSQRALTDQSGEIVEYNYPFKPEAEAPRALPAYIERLLQTAKEDMRDIGSFHEVSQAQGEPGLRSGKAVLALQDADDLIQTVPLQLIDSGLREVGAKLLRICHKFVDEERLVRITGRNRELQVFSFTGKSLQGSNVNLPGANYFDVRVMTFSAYPLTRIGMEQRIENLIRLGVLDPREHRHLIMSMLSNSDLGSELDRGQTDRTQATEENYQLLRGEQVQAFSIEDHDLHIDTHTEFFKSRIHKLSTSPDGEKLIMNMLKHIDMHEKLRTQNNARKNMLAVQEQVPFLMAGGFNPQAMAGA